MANVNENDPNNNQKQPEPTTQNDNQNQLINEDEYREPGPSDENMYNISDLNFVEENDGKKLK